MSSSKRPSGYSVDTVREGVALLRRVLEAVGERGPSETAMRRRLEGAALGAELAVGLSSPLQEQTRGV